MLLDGFDGQSGSHQLHDRRDRNAHASNTGLTAHDLWIKRDVRVHGTQRIADSQDTVKDADCGSRCRQRAHADDALGGDFRLLLDAKKCQTLRAFEKCLTLLQVSYKRSLSSSGETPAPRKMARSVPGLTDVEPWTGTTARRDRSVA